MSDTTGPQQPAQPAQEPQQPTRSWVRRRAEQRPMPDSLIWLEGIRVGRPTEERR